MQNFFYVISQYYIADIGYALFYVNHKKKYGFFFYQEQGILELNIS